MKQKMYWKNGFYDTLVDGAVEISVEYWKKLLDGQSSGKLIVTNDEGYPVLVENEYSLEDMQKIKVSEIQSFDKSKEVNSFELRAKSMWLDKSTRVGLFNSINIEKEAGKTETALWYDAVKYIIPISDALAMLNALEMYALECYNVTQSHIAAVKASDTIEEIESYDYTYKPPHPLQLHPLDRNTEYYHHHPLHNRHYHFVCL